MHVLVMLVEQRDGDAGERPNIVVIDLGGEDIDQRLVGAGLGDGDDDLRFGLRRVAVGGGSRLQIADDGLGELPAGQGGGACSLSPS
ncbi:hypothetical protein, partial [Azospirillum brasilense]|uniref:hypothetical protein n=1 Tax=Azospirillum brasilense TaxID=192 RepID=UPI002494D894